jgi:thymidylate synthase
MTRKPNEPLFVEGSSFSNVWSQALRGILDTPGKEVAPLVAVVHVDSPGPFSECAVTRAALDILAKKNGWPPTSTVASSLFPVSLWNSTKPRAELYRRFDRIRNRLSGQAGPGRYFERLTCYGKRGEQTNQLEKILQVWGGGVRRRSLLQAGVFDPLRDHTRQRRRGFPCLQQVSFAPISGGGLTVNGFYATQNIADRAYGNYLGLAHLGRFMAHELGLELRRVTCVAALAFLGKGKVGEMKSLLSSIGA